MFDVKKRTPGFTLIELLIVIAVIGILASLVYPGFKDYVFKARRQDAKTALMDLAGKMENFYRDNHTYVGATIAAGALTDVLTSASSPEGWYQLAIITSTPSTYTLQATPVKAQEADSQCQAFTMTDKGIKGLVSGPAGAPRGTVNNCW